MSKSTVTIITGTSSHATSAAASLTSSVVMDKALRRHNHQGDEALFQRLSLLQGKLKVKSKGQLREQLQETQMHQEAQTKVNKARAAIAQTLALNKNLRSLNMGGPEKSSKSEGICNAVEDDCLPPLKAGSSRTRLRKPGSSSLFQRKEGPSGLSQLKAYPSSLPPLKAGSVDLRHMRGEANLLPLKAVRANLPPLKSVKANLHPLKAKEAILPPLKATKVNLHPLKATKANLHPLKAKANYPLKATQANLPQLKAEHNYLPPLRAGHSGFNVVFH